MKNTLFLFLALLVYSAGSAQAIKPDTLLGEWKLRKIATRGTMADLKTGDVSISDAFAREKGQSKEALTEQFKARIPGMHGTLNFYTGNRMEYQISGKEVQGSYIITQESGKEYLADEYSGSKIEIYFKENLLYWEVLSKEGFVTMAWERQP